eukprot:GDKK01028729.1.p1 GENE.GDKK01028729.1~~GDKK01028729.1.p1  ORF type:complete len:137 (-),score=31.51 GDKK01028729.1:7-378(-)
MSQQTSATKKLNIDAPAWTPSFGGGASSAAGLAEISLPASNLHPHDDGYDEHDDGHDQDEHAELDEYYDGEFVTDHTSYEQQDTDWHQHQEWASMMQHQQQQYGFSNAAFQSGRLVFTRMDVE